MLLLLTPTPNMIERLTRQDFSELATLRLAGPAGPMTLEVVQTRELPPTSPRPNPFAVLLQGPAEPLLPQGIYALQHPVQGTLDLFMVPVGRGPKGIQYEVIFN